MTVFGEARERYLPMLEQYVPVVARVHGPTHPEFYDVKQVFDKIVAKLEAAGEEKPELDAEFEKLRQITGNYTVPGDVCETYEAVYNMLAELDKAYQA